MLQPGLRRDEVTATNVGGKNNVVSTAMIFMDEESRLAAKAVSAEVRESLRLNSVSRCATLICSWKNWLALWAADGPDGQIRHGF